MIVGFGHVKQSGKDTAAKILVDHFGFERIGFADDLKAAAYALDPWISSYHTRLQDIVDEHGWDKAKELYPEIRRILQRLGTEVGRDIFGEDFWVDRVLTKILTRRNVVIPDVRFPSEAEAIIDSGGVVIRIDRPGYLPIGHISETALADWDGWDTTISNDGTIDDLAAKLFEYFGDTRIQ